jgi:hypothetical protein
MQGAQIDRESGLMGNTATRPAFARLHNELQKTLAAVPRGMTLVAFHTAVLAYVRPQSDRDAFTHMVSTSGATWISNEAPDVFSEIAQERPARVGLIASCLPTRQPDRPYRPVWPIHRMA